MGIHTTLLPQLSKAGEDKAMIYFLLSFFLILAMMLMLSVGDFGDDDDIMGTGPFGS